MHISDYSKLLNLFHSTLMAQGDCYHSHQTLHHSKINIAEKVDTVTPSRIYCTSLVSQFHVDVEDASTSCGRPPMSHRVVPFVPLAVPVCSGLSRIASHPD
ncbi:hypothetical protein NPIL_107391 [Nephila pilipes]|uniref:Uncharacterized protein n=1 Tax=Nephila pilipes TaxID=299642 RepID=A0A8X6TR27_NEPPI|nr:hypothetical protein NPIL_107391 [Nephila pilipes]